MNILLELEPDELQELAAAYIERWGPTEELLAACFDMLAIVQTTIVRANVKQGTHVPEPPKYPRPNRPRRTTITPTDLARTLSHGG